MLQRSLRLRATVRKVDDVDRYPAICHCRVPLRLGLGALLNKPRQGAAPQFKYLLLSTRHNLKRVHH